MAEEDSVLLTVKAEVLFERIANLHNTVNYENKIRRNAICACGSGKKWKKCCLPVHEKNTNILEEMVKEYRDICIKIRKEKI
jgi:hypothetical protein|tara:strand:+ start:705 stop:950 length:246 start_codon:yes stop_codon:yes gene_type:complete